MVRWDVALFADQKADSEQVLVGKWAVRPDDIGLGNKEAANPTTELPMIIMAMIVSSQRYNG